MMELFDMRNIPVRNSTLGELWLERLWLTDDRALLIVRRPNTACPFTAMQSHKSFTEYSNNLRYTTNCGVLRMLIDLQTALPLLMGKEDELNLFEDVKIYETLDRNKVKYTYSRLKRGGFLDDDVIRFIIRLYDGSSKPSQLVAAMKDLNLWPEEYHDAKFTYDLLGGLRLTLVDSKPGILGDLLKRIITLSRG